MAHHVIWSCHYPIEDEEPLKQVEDMFRFSFSVIVYIEQFEEQIEEWKKAGKTGDLLQSS